MMKPKFLRTYFASYTIHLHELISSSEEVTRFDGFLLTDSQEATQTVAKGHKAGL